MFHKNECRLKVEGWASFEETGSPDRFDIWWHECIDLGFM
jgi:hypothetical protein